MMIKYGVDPRPEYEEEDTTLSIDEMEAFYRLQALGFSTEKVREAFMMFDKDEEKTADFLFADQENDTALQSLTQSSKLEHNQIIEETRGTSLIF